MKEKLSAAVLLMGSFLLILSGCGGNKKKSGQSKSSKKSEQKMESISHTGVLFGGSFFSLEDGNLEYYSEVIPGTEVEICFDKNNKIESIKDDSGENRGTFIHVKNGGDNFWVEEINLVQNATASYILETGSDVFLFEEPNADSKMDTKINFDTIVANFGACKDSAKNPEGSKFCHIKIPLDENGAFLDAYARLSQVDSSKAHLALIQVSKKYAQLKKSGNVSAEVLTELEDTIEDLRSWSGR